MEIRSAKPGELDALRELVEHAYGPYVERIGRRPAPMDDAYAAKIADGLVDVAVAAGEPCGLIVLVAQADHLLVENVAVDPGFQGRGIGRALLAHAERTAADLSLSELRLYTNAAMTENLRLYPQLGYLEAGRQTDQGFERVYFTKRLPSNGREHEPQRR